MENVFGTIIKAFPQKSNTTLNIKGSHMRLISVGINLQSSCAP